MAPERHNILGEVSLGQSARLVFSLSNHAGQQFAHVRKFVSTSRYTGPTRSGFMASGNQLNQLVTMLRGLAGGVPSAGQTQIGVVARSGSSEFHLQLVPPDDGASFPSIDIREHIRTATYVGFTKKGIRFSWEKLPEVIRHFEVQLAALGEVSKTKPTLFPEMQPEWERETIEDQQRGSELQGLLGKVSEFPTDFLPAGTTLGEALELPRDSVELKTDRENRWFVCTFSGYRHAVKNEVEGKFILYAQLRGHTVVQLPVTMIHIFKTVAAYEKYCRDQFKRIVHALELKCKNRQLAEYQARQLFKSDNLPIV